MSVQVDDRDYAPTRSALQSPRPVVFDNSLKVLPLVRQSGYYVHIKQRHTHVKRRRPSPIQHIVKKLKMVY